MPVDRITVFVPPEIDNIIAVTDCLGRAGVNGVVMSIDRLHMGNTIRFIVDKPRAALKALLEADYTAKRENIIAAEIDDTPGSLASFLELIKSSIDFQSLQVIPSGKDMNKAIVLLMTTQKHASRMIEQAGIRVLGAKDLT